MANDVVQPTWFNGGEGEKQLPLNYHSGQLRLPLWPGEAASDSIEAEAGGDVRLIVSYHRRPDGEGLELDFRLSGRDVSLLLTQAQVAELAHFFNLNSAIIYKQTKPMVVGGPEPQPPTPNPQPPATL